MCSPLYFFLLHSGEGAFSWCFHPSLGSQQHLAIAFDDGHSVCSVLTTNYCGKNYISADRDAAPREVGNLCTRTKGEADGNTLQAEEPRKAHSEA